MRRTVFMALSFSATLLFVGNLFALDMGRVEGAVENCRKDIETYCKNIRPGEGRLLTCLHAHEGRLTPRCADDLNNASTDLQQAIEALAYVSRECRDDLAAYCAAPRRPQDGTLLDCLNKQSRLSLHCSEALNEVGLRQPMGEVGGK